MMWSNDADGPNHRAAKTIGVAVDPELLLGRAHGDENDLRLTFIYVFDHPLVVRGIRVEGAVMGAHDIEPRLNAPQVVGCIRARSAARSRVGTASGPEAPTRLPVPHSQSTRVIRTAGSVQQPRRQAEALALAVDEVRPTQCGGQLRRRLATC